MTDAAEVRVSQARLKPTPSSPNPKDHAMNSEVEARELLAREHDARGDDVTAARLRELGGSTSIGEECALRAIVAALQPCAWLDREAWRPIESAPKGEMAVIVFFANVTWRDYQGKAVFLSPMREHVERCELGWYADGVWREAGTGHDMFESWRTVDQLPTHWQPLPAAPPPPNEMGRGR